MALRFFFDLGKGTKIGDYFWCRCPITKGRCGECCRVGNGPVYWGDWTVKIKFTPGTNRFSTKLYTLSDVTLNFTVVTCRSWRLPLSVFGYRALRSFQQRRSHDQSRFNWTPGANRRRLRKSGGWHHRPQWYDGRSNRNDKRHGFQPIESDFTVSSNCG